MEVSKMFMSMRWLAIGVMISIVLASLFVGCTPEPGVAPSEPSEEEGLPTVTWRWQSAYTPLEWTDKTMIPAFDWLEEQTDGKFKVEVLYAGDLMPTEEMLSGIGQGLCEFGEGNTSYWVGTEPALDLVAGIPMTNRGPLGDAWAFQMLGPWSEIATEIFAENGCYYLGWHTYGPYPMIYSTKPIHNLEDFKGLKVRTSGYSAKLFDALGASTCYIPGAEIYEAMMLGTIDVATWTSEGITDMKFGEIMEYWVLPAFMDHMGGVTMINEEAWEALPYEYQELLKGAELRMGWLNSEWQRRYLIEGEENATGAGTSGLWGYDVVYLSDEDVAELSRLASEEVWPEFAKQSPRCAQGIEMVKEWYSVHRW